MCIWKSKAEEIEMAWNLALGGQTGQKMQNQSRGRGRFQRGRGRFNAVQTVSPSQPQNVPMQQAQPFAVQSVQSTNTAGKVNAQCYNCSGYGHFYWDAHLHRRQDSEEEDVVEDSKVLKEIQRMLL